MRFSKLVALFICLLFAGSVFAAEQEIRKKLSTALPMFVIDTVEQSEIEGLYRVTARNGQIIYSDAKADFFLSGELYGFENKRLVNISEQRRQTVRSDALASVDAKDRIVFPAEGTKKASIAVFTDIDCGYCRKLHSEVPRLNELGIEVSYLAYPRAGIGSSSYDKIVSAWCADDQLQAMTDAKAGKKIPSKTCDNPVAAQFEMGGQMGVTGTPALLLEDGTLIPGYVPADKLAKQLGIL